MVVLLILVLSCLIFRGLGFTGIPAFATWQASARDALSPMLVFTGVSHFTFVSSGNSDPLNSRNSEPSGKSRKG